MEKWPIRYSGDGGLSLTDFLLKIELYAKAEDVPEHELYRGIFKLLEGVAMEWYEVKAQEYRTWKELVQGMKSRFLSQNYEYRAREEILSRFQLPSEKITDYLLHMAKLFLKVYPPLDDGYKIYILQRNMLPQFRMQLTVANVSTMQQLERLCKNMDEATYVNNSQPAYPIRPQNPAQGPRRAQQNCNLMDEVVAIRTDVNRTGFVRPQAGREFRRENMIGVCWNCRKVGHRHFDCPDKLTRLYCWCCGMDGVTAERCPRNHKGGSLFRCTDQTTENPQNSGNANAGS